ncbi:MAG TPA: hypothetical protein VFA03_13310 [Acetobacteraceae bacterium]|nr:hypothetical protein [Acetobacteraceae bacterium]
MIDNPNDAFAQYEAQARLRAQLAREVTPLNKAAMFAVLQAAGVQRVTVHFDVAECTIRPEYNERVTTTSYSEPEF